MRKVIMYLGVSRGYISVPEVEREPDKSAEATTEPAPDVVGPILFRVGGGVNIGACDKLDSIL
jgi:hypothetical protein